MKKQVNISLLKLLKAKNCYNEDLYCKYINLFYLKFIYK